jgi:Ca2+/H+ antiporter, TMEM165/GDT1 family
VDSTTTALLGSVFVASLVEFVEAFTIVLAMGVTRGWRSALAGTAAALVALAGFTAVLGYGIQTWLPEALLKLVIGGLLLILGLQWLRKAVLRSSGHKALHDEEAEYAEQQEAAARAERTTYAGIDAFGFLVSFKGVFLEGVEVVVIVITFGLTADSLGLAIAAAAVAGVLVTAIGIALRKPMAAVPENTLKYVVGLMLTTFGTFWSLEGVGYFRSGHDSIEWPGDTWSLLALLTVWFLLTRALVAALSRDRAEVSA